ncbi:MAG: DUF4349 domain-containing protein [Bacteroidota bacterium]
MIRYSTFLLFIFLFSSCVSRKLYDQQSTGATTVSYELRQEADLEESYDEFLADRLIIYTAYISVVVKGLEEQREKLQSFVKQHQAYVESSSTNSWTIRVPQDSFNSLLAQIETLGEVNNKNLYSQDVTDQYRDTEIRLETLEKSRQRYLELLNKAEKVSEILEIERELERINVEIESMKGQLKRLDSKVQYATITVSLQEKIKPGPLGVVGVGLYKVVKWLFVWN